VRSLWGDLADDSYPRHAELLRDAWLSAGARAPQEEDSQPKKKRSKKNRKSNGDVGSPDAENSGFQPPENWPQLCGESELLDYLLAPENIQGTRGRIDRLLRDVSQGVVVANPADFELLDLVMPLPVLQTEVKRFKGNSRGHRDQLVARLVSSAAASCPRYRETISQLTRQDRQTLLNMVRLSGTDALASASNHKLLVERAFMLLVVAESRRTAILSAERASSEAT
jgi:hypothetical protein